MKMPARLKAADLFVLLEKEFRRKTRRCGKCAFSLPYRVTADGRDRREGAWSVIPGEGCTNDCRAILEDLVGDFQKTYRLSDTGSFRAGA